MELSEIEDGEPLSGNGKIMKYSDTLDESRNRSNKTEEYKYNFDDIEDKAENRMLDQNSCEGKETSVNIEMENEDGHWKEAADDIRTGREEVRRKKNGRQQQGESAVLYSVEENPPWHLCILLGFQVIIFLHPPNYNIDLADV